MARIVVVGDVGGCLRQLAEAVSGLIEDEDTVVVQVGDLVDRGPDTPGVLAFVGERLAAAPARWVQLIGNHESQYLIGVDPKHGRAGARQWAPLIFENATLSA